VVEASEPKAKEQLIMVVVVVRSSAARTNCDYYIVNDDDDDGDDVVSHDVALQSSFEKFDSVLALALNSGF